jgi:hypothetical protein
LLVLGEYPHLEHDPPSFVVQRLSVFTALTAKTFEIEGGFDAYNTLVPILG